MQTSAQLAGVVEAAFRQFGAVGLSQFIEAALAQLETMLPARARVAALELDPAPLTRQFEDALELDEFTPSDLRRLAAVALSLAILNEE